MPFKKDLMGFLLVILLLTVALSIQLCGYSLLTTLAILGIVICVLMVVF